MVAFWEALGVDPDDLGGEDAREIANLIHSELNARGYEVEGIAPVLNRDLHQALETAREDA
ncbi:hypothetical protein [Halorussus salinus]|uniref:hypothetical protein n=1 Tax=Halorussus salinus TaxID=1364935 RepID=UPI00109319B2|nr:hypothetical protein [Halorussus salinus]